MFGHVPDEPFIRKAPAGSRADCTELMAEFAGRVDAILVYSVFALRVRRGLGVRLRGRLPVPVAPGGQLLLGDIPNNSKRKRFFASAAGVAHHRSFTGTDEVPAVAFNAWSDPRSTTRWCWRSSAPGGGVRRVRPGEAPDLPMANRREDVLIVRP